MTARLTRRHWLAAAGLLPLLAACDTVLNKPFPEKRSYVLTAKRPERRPMPANDLILGVRRFRAGPGYEGRGLVTRMDSVSVRQDFYNEFFVTPASLVEELAGAWLGDAGIFSQVSPALAQELPTHALEGTLTSLYGDYSQGGASGLAVIELQLLLLEIRRGPGAVQAQQSYRKSLPLPNRDPETLVAGWNRLMAEILTDFEERVRAGMR